MKTSSALGLAVVLAAAPACSGRYEVGGEGQGGEAGSGAPVAGTGSAAGGGGSVAGSGSGGLAGSSPAGGVAGSSPSGFGGSAPCGVEAEPPPLVGELVEPAVVWERVTRLVEGEGAPPPSNLPAVTTYAWAGDVVVQAFGRARLQDSAYGASALLSEWLFQEASPPLEVDWGNVLLDDGAPVLDKLLLEPVGEERYGAFSEPSWLQRFPSISARGSRIYGKILGYEPPPAPLVLPEPEPSDTLTRRQELGAVVGTNPACAACHVAFDPFGYAFGHFDELGEYQEREDGLPIDTSGSFRDPYTGFSFSDLRDMGVKAAASCDAKKGIVLSLTRAALAMEGLESSEQHVLVDRYSERLQQAFLSSEARSYADWVRAYAQSPLVLQR